MGMPQKDFMVITTLTEVLALTDVLVSFVWAITMTYLTDVWEMKMVHAAAIVNIFNGATELIPFALRSLTYGDGGLQRMALASASSFAVGLGLLAMSLPPVLAKHTGTCSDYKPECIGHVQKSLFFVSLAIIAFAGAAYRCSLKPIADKIGEVYSEVEEFSDANLSCSSACTYLLGFFTEVGLFVIIILIQLLKPWSTRYGMAAIISLMGLVVFMCYGSCCSHVRSMPARARPTRNSTDPMYYIFMIPLWLTYIACGVVSSVGNTYFSEQANHMKTLKIGHLHLGYIFLLWISEKIKKVFAKIQGSFSKSSINSPLVAIGVSMVFAVLCCITAAKVEARRLQQVASHGLIDKPEETIPMTVFWMLPQLVLLGVFDGLFQNSAEEFVLCKFIPSEMWPSTRCLTKSMFGVGIIGSSFSVYVVGKISERVGSKHNWFQSTINQSRLDNYYWVLATYSALNLLFYFCVAAYCSKSSSASDSDSWDDLNQRVARGEFTRE